MLGGEINGDRRGAGPGRVWRGPRYVPWSHALPEAVVYRGEVGVSPFSSLPFLSLARCGASLWLGTQGTRLHLVCEGGALGAGGRGRNKACRRWLSLAQTWGPWFGVWGWVFFDNL